MRHDAHRSDVARGLLLRGSVKRRGISALVLVVAAAMIIMIWAASQQFVNGSVTRRVVIAEAGRRCLIQAATAVEEGIEFLTAELNEGPEPGSPPDEALAAKFRQLRPGDILEFSYQPTVAELPDGAGDVHLDEVHGQAFLVDISGENGEPPKTFNCQKYKDFLIKWNESAG